MRRTHTRVTLTKDLWSPVLIVHDKINTVWKEIKLWMFHTLAQLLSHFCQIPVIQSQIGQTVEQSTQPRCTTRWITLYFVLLLTILTKFKFQLVYLQNQIPDVLHPTEVSLLPYFVAVPRFCVPTPTDKLVRLASGSQWGKHSSSASWLSSPSDGWRMTGLVNGHVLSS